MKTIGFAVGLVVRIIVGICMEIMLFVMNVIPDFEEVVKND